MLWRMVDPDQDTRTLAFSPLWSQDMYVKCMRLAAMQEICLNKQVRGAPGFSHIHLKPHPAKLN
jgi:hypothetical protein